MTRTLKVDFFTDIVCPWCLVGAARLDTAIAGLPPDVAVDVEVHPFYLDPTTPPEGYDVAQMLRQKYGRDPKQMWARVESEAKNAGVDLDLSKQPRSFPTQKGHTLVRLARDKGTQKALSRALADACFLEHRQVNDEAVLIEIATQHGFTAEEARAAIHDDKELAISHELAMWAAQQGIRGVPFFVIANAFALSGAQPQEVFDMALAKGLEQGAPA